MERMSDYKKEFDLACEKIAELEEENKVIKEEKEMLIRQNKLLQESNKKLKERIEALELCIDVD